MTREAFQGVMRPATFYIYSVPGPESPSELG